MKTIYKYEVRMLDYTNIKGKIEKFLSVQYQPRTEQFCVWAIVDDSLDEREFVISCYGTGHQLPDVVGEYLGTVEILSGAIVLHFFIEDTKVQAEGGYRSLENKL